MPRGDGTGPPWGSGAGSGRSAGRCLSPRSSNSFKTGGSRVQRYATFVEAFIPFVAVVSGLVKLFKKPKGPNTLLNDTSVEPSGPENLKRGDEYAEG